jgi:hypothetical protein
MVELKVFLKNLIIFSFLSLFCFTKEQSNSSTISSGTFEELEYFQTSIKIIF